ncbi:MAG: hypothetical protein MUC41_13590 [Syntrophobacteraceae bacterium]|jgi:hypothetical protein|nr:hypothetical protein [Syntrophobacteraceae bacterium]
MNPEEGELRPQLLDRFGLCVRIEGIRDIEARVAIMERRTAFDEDPPGFCRLWEEESLELSRRIRQATALYPKVFIDRHHTKRTEDETGGEDDEAEWGKGFVLHAGSVAAGSLGGGHLQAGRPRLRLGVHDPGSGRLDLAIPLAVAMTLLITKAAFWLYKGCPGGLVSPVAVGASEVAGRGEPEHQVADRGQGTFHRRSRTSRSTRS